MKQDQEVSLKVRLITYAVTALLVVVMAVGSVAFASWQRNQKLEQQKQAQIAAALKKQQLANVEAIKATLPLFRETKQGVDKIMVKVPIESLPTTITAGLDPDVELGNPFCSPVDVTPGQWTIKNNRTNTIVASNDDLNDWAAAEDGAVTIPALSSSDYGKYTLTYNSNEACVPEGGGDSYSVYIYVFKIVPPCPTSVTLTH